VDHGLEAEIDFTTANDFGDIARVVGLEESNLEAFLCEVTLGLSEVDRGVVGGGMPTTSCQSHCSILTTIKGKRATDQLDRKVILSVDILKVIQGRKADNVSKSHP